MLARGGKKGGKKKREKKKRLQSPGAKGRALKFLHIAVIYPPRYVQLQDFLPFGV